MNYTVTHTRTSMMISDTVAHTYANIVHFNMTIDIPMPPEIQSHHCKLYLFFFNQRTKQRHQRNIWSAFNLLVDDVLRYEGPDTSYNLSSLFAEFRSQPSNLISQQQIYQTLQKSTHYLRLAYSSATETGDFTRAALASLNGSFIPPKTGRT